MLKVIFLISISNRILILCFSCLQFYTPSNNSKYNTGKQTNRRANSMMDGESGNVPVWYKGITIKTLY